MPKPMSTEDTGNAAENPATTGANSLSVVPDASDVDPAAIQSERRRRIAIAQDEELKWLNLTTILRGNSDKLKYRAARDAWKIAERFLLTDDNVLYYIHLTPRNQQDNQEELRLRLVVPTTMIQEVLQNNHDSLEGGHQGVVRTYQRVKQDYYWFGLYADVEKHCAFTGFAIAKPMSDTTAFKVAQVFEECIYRRFGAPSLIRHGRDPRFMSEVFQAFAEMMQSRSSAILSYRPQANGQQERSVKTVMQSVKSRRARLHNNALSKMEKTSLQNEDAEDSARQDGEDSATKLKTRKKKLFEEGSRAWLYMARVKPGLTKKLAHRWHGPFRIKKKVDEFAFELELPDKSGYRFYPVG
ncbi:hypothetical protein PHMEG_00035312 [Phytophthora megakarya]|uniref:Integrase catalytic domain-containing protein n=1 Tax=Phytophthora megakarya TaxID=4795 RepID=A0A225UPB8_9STRA|nr:hypothetical protein PHMEG_00035312 [Phytophthora megakarya]